MPGADMSSTGGSRGARIAIVVLLCAAAIAYAAWPLASAARLLSAARAGDAATIQDHVDFPRLRRSLARQIVTEAVRLHPLQGPERHLALGAGTTALAAWLDELLTASVLANLIGGRALEPAAATAPVDLSVIQIAPLRGLARIWWRSGFVAPMRYDMTLQKPDGRDALIVGMELRGITWRVTRIELTEEVRQSLARRLVAVGSAKQAQP